MQGSNRIKAREGKSQASLDSQGRITDIKHDADIQTNIQKNDMLAHLNKDFNNTLKDIKRDQLKDEEDKAKAEEELQKNKIEKEKELARNASASIVTIVNEQYNAQEQRQQRYLSRLQETYQEDMSIAGTNTQAKIQLTEQYRQREIAAQREIIDIKRKEAEFDEAASVLNIAIKVAEAVAASKLQASILLSNPATAPLAALALSQIPIEIATGALQTAAVLAKPLPSYFKGTDDHPGGFAMVGEQGEELIKYPSGLIDLTPRHSTIMDLPRGTEVLPNKDTLKFLALAGLKTQDVRVKGMNLKEVVEGLSRVETAITKQKTKFPNYAKMASGVYELRKEGDAFMKSVLALTVSKK